MERFESKLYRDINDIIHPTISRKNISQYEIIIKEELIPLKVYYPSIDSELNKIAIYIHGNEICNDFYEEFAFKTGYIVVLLEYNKDNNKDIQNTINYLIKGLNDNNIEKDSILLIGDYSGADIILELSNENKDDSYSKLKKILLSPRLINLDEYNIDNGLVLSNNEEIKVNESINCLLLKESIYDFLHDIDMVANEKVYKIIIDYVKGDNK